MVRQEQKILFELIKSIVSKQPEMNVLKNLGLNVVKAKVHPDSSGKHNTFSITKSSTGRKVDDPELLEAIRIKCSISNLDVDIATRIRISDDSPDRSLLSVETADRPGLLVDLVKIVTDINVAVESGEFDTEKWKPLNSEVLNM
ncbi:hypothetical protein L2E82_02044 [Cichorium intybus]|uniref:Uncharacterized protein n=1 Tax=Cichorium intybus TaxID=13427 RepID=A0ACB9H2Q4_CICIN|nr:hypothetical protein L2E82_02044 [Cichorium intybus]